MNRPLTTLALERDLELMQRLDALGFDEAWIGEQTWHDQLARTAVIRDLRPPSGAPV